MTSLQCVYALLSDGVAQQIAGLDYERTSIFLEGVLRETRDTFAMVSAFLGRMNLGLIFGLCPWCVHP